MLKNLRNNDSISGYFTISKRLPTTASVSKKMVTVKPVSDNHKKPCQQKMNNFQDLV